MTPVQSDLFGAPPARGSGAAVQPAASVPEHLVLARRVPKNVHFGTSSWSFPGWAGIVYAEIYSQTALARHGLAAYAEHPLLRGVGLDKTFYAPPAAAELRRLADAVPADFRFLAKAWSGLTTAPESPRAARLGNAPPVFLDADFAAREVVAPLAEGLGDRLGAILFQFSPLGPAHTQAPARFAGRLERFLRTLPRGPDYAVELRDAELLGPEYEAALAAAGAVHCHNVHPRMPPADRQVAAAARGPLVVRWMLHPAMDYEAAARRYAPFDRLVDPDPHTRRALAQLVSDAADAGRTVHLVAGNNAEGSAPLTIFELARTLVAFRDGDPGARPPPC